MNRNRMSKFDEKYVSKIKELNKRIIRGESIEEIYEELKDHRIMEISIVSEFNNETEILNGTILVNEDCTFEGVVDNNNIIKGKLLGEKGIILTNFCNYKKASNYCGINKDGVYMGKHEVYSFDGNIDNGSILIELTTSQKNFESEIGVEYKLDKVKEYFDDYVKEIYYWYSNNMDSEIDRILHSLKDGVEERLLNVLKLRLKTLKESQKVDVLAVSCKSPFVIESDKAEKFKSSADSKEDNEQVKKMAEILKKNNLANGEILVLKK